MDFGVAKIAGDGRDLRTALALHGLGDGLESLIPARFLKLAVLLHIGPVETAIAEAVAGEAGLVGDPLLVHVLVQARQNPHHLTAARIDPDIAADGVHDVDRFGLLQFPRPRHEGVGLRGQRPDRTEIDHVARKLGIERLFEIGRDLHVLAAADGPEIRHARDLGREADAAGAVNAAGHDRLDQWPHILLFDRALVLGIAAGSLAEIERLVLQIAFAALIADRAIERMVDEQEFHHPFARLLDERGVGLDHHPVADRHRAGCDRLRRFFHFDEAHAAIAGDRKPFVIAEARNFGAGLLAGLQHRDTGLDLDLFTVDR